MVGFGLRCSLTLILEKISGISMESKTSIDIGTSVLVASVGVGTCPACFQGDVERQPNTM